MTQPSPVSTSLPSFQAAGIPGTSDTHRHREAVRRFPATWRCAVSGLPVLDLSPEDDGDLHMLQSAVLLTRTRTGDVFILHGRVDADRMVGDDGSVLVDGLSSKLAASRPDFHDGRARLVLASSIPARNGANGRPKASIDPMNLPVNLRCENPSGWRADTLLLLAGGWISYVDALHPPDLDALPQPGRTFVAELCRDAAWLLRFRADPVSIERLRHQERWMLDPPALTDIIELTLAARDEWKERAAQAVPEIAAADPSCLTCIRLFFGLRQWVEKRLPGRPISIRPPAPGRYRLSGHIAIHTAGHTAGDIAGPMAGPAEDRRP